MNRTKQEKIVHSLNEIDWEYAPNDPDALGILRERIAQTGRIFGLISYSDLVKGVDFHYPNMRKGEAYRISIHDWTGLDRRIIGDCLGYISMESYKEAGFMASALVISRMEAKPADNFFEWMGRLEVLPDLREITVLRFWTEQVRLAHKWYKYGKKVPDYVEG